MTNDTDRTPTGDPPARLTAALDTGTTPATRTVVHESDACQGNVSGWTCADCEDDDCEHECHDTGPTGDLRERLAEALNEWTLEAAGASRVSPPVHPRTLENLRANSLARADAVLHVIEGEILAVQVDATRRADELAARLQQAETETAALRERAEEAERQTQAVIDEVLTVCDSFVYTPDDTAGNLYSLGREDGLTWARAAVERAMGKGQRNSVSYVPKEEAEEAERQRDEALAADRRVRDLHFRHDCDACDCTLCWSMGGMCGGCRNPYPCPTVRALDQPKDMPR